MSDESPLRFEPIRFGDPDPAPPAPLPQAQAEAQAKLDAIKANRDHRYHRSDMQAAEQVLELTRQSLGEAGRQVMFQIGTPAPDDRSAAAAADVPPPPAGVSDPPAAEVVEAVEIPAALQGDVALVDSIQETTQHLSVSPAEVRTLLDHVVRTAGDTPMDAAGAEATLRERWGARYDAGLAAAQHFYSVLPLGLQAQLEAVNYDNDPAVIAQFARWGARMMDAQRAINAIQGDREHAANNPGHRDHARARETLRKLYLRAYGSHPVLTT